MTTRAIIAGLLLGLFISGFTHFNDMFIRGSWFINNHLPIAVLGLLVLLMLTVNPLLRSVGRKLALSGAEMAVIVALGLASCGWPSFAFYTYFIPISAMPNHWQATEASWHATGVMRYLPGGDPALAEGHVQDWRELVRAVAQPERRQADPVLDRLWEQVGADGQRLLSHYVDGSVPPEARRDVLRVINHALQSGDLTPQPPPEPASLPDPMQELLQRHLDQPLTGRPLVRLNRWWLVVTLPEVVLPPPRGEGVLLAGGQGGLDAVDEARSGSGELRWPHELPWGVWWPTLRLWGLVGLLLGLAALCLTLIVHPQWSRRELLPYPIARFVTELSARDANNWLPNITQQRTFWLGMGTMAFVHGLNGLHAWYPELPNIPLKLEMTALQELFPNFSRVMGTNHLFQPYIYFSAIAFCFFLATPVSFSLGMASTAYGLLGAALLAGGLSFQNDYMGAEKANLLRFGAYVGMAGLIAYVGRRYYLNVIGATLGLPRTADTPAYAVWAARTLVVLFALTVVLFHSAGLSWGLGIVFVLLLLLIFLVLTRIVVETGMFFVQVWWMPVGILTGLFGFEAIGPTSYIVLAVGSAMLVGDPRTQLMPYLANGLQIVDRAGAAAPSRLAPWLTVMVVIGFIASGVTLFTITYSYGFGAAGPWNTQHLPSMPFDQVASYISESAAQQTLADATAAEGLDRFRAIRLVPSTWGWMLLGMALLVTTAAARLRLPWWPIHPVLFLVWGTMPASRLAVSFLIGWLIKLAVVRVSGSRGYRQLLPLMVGIIAGELLMGLIWTGIGGIYYGIEGVAPPEYRIYP